MTFDEARQSFTDAGWPTKEWPEAAWVAAALELKDLDSVHDGDMASIVAHYGLWN